MVAEFRRRMLALVRDLDASGYVEMAREMCALLDRWRLSATREQSESSRDGSGGSLA